MILTAKCLRRHARSLPQLLPNYKFPLVGPMEDSLHGIFHQILDAPGVLAAGSKKGANIPSGLNEFLSKIPGYLESCPNIVLSLNEDQASVILGRRQFLFWFLRRLSVLSRWGPSGPTHSHCHLIQSALLRLVLSRQPSLFKDLVQDYVRTLEGQSALSNLIRYRRKVDSFSHSSFSVVSLLICSLPRSRRCSGL